MIEWATISTDRAKLALACSINFGLIGYLGIKNSGPCAETLANRSNYTSPFAKIFRQCAPYATGALMMVASEFSPSKYQFPIQFGLLIGAVFAGGELSWKTRMYLIAASTGVAATGMPVTALIVGYLATRILVSPLPHPIERKNLIKMLLISPQECLDTKNKMIGYPSISECDCLRFIRDYRKNVEGVEGARLRSQIEDDLIRILKTDFHPTKDKPLTICSIASQGCFQELVIHARLVDAGYKVNWILVDPIYGVTPQEHPTIKEFSCLAKLISQETEITVYQNALETIPALAGEKRPDVFLMMDPDLNGTPMSDILLEEKFANLEVFPGCHKLESHLFQMIQSDRYLKYPRLFAWLSATRVSQGNVEILGT